MHDKVRIKTARQSDGSIWGVALTNTLIESLVIGLKIYLLEFRNMILTLMVKDFPTFHIHLQIMPVAQFLDFLDERAITLV